jgi:inorganic pyrophosphatase
MSISNFPQAVKQFALKPYVKPRDVRELCQTHVAFCGSPMQHPQDSRKILLVADAAGSNPFYYEFYAQDIECMDELPHVTNPAGETITMARVWLKKGSVGVRCIPFVVEQVRSR